MIPYTAVIGAIIGPNEVLERLAVGGQADVFLARGQNGRRVVVKRLLRERVGSPGYRERLLAEGRLGLLCEHPALVRTLEVGEDDGLAWLALEYLQGETLEEALQRAGCPPWLVAVDLVRALLLALDHLHGLADEDGSPLGVVHRDVCPANIMLARNGRVRLFDLGVATETSLPDSYDPGLLAGRPAYAAPEAVRGRPLDGRADIWSAAVILHELLTCERLFRRYDAVRTLTAVVGAPIPAPSDRRPGLDPALDRVVMRGLRREPVERWRTATEFEAALSEWAAGKGEATRWLAQ